MKEQLTVQEKYRDLKLSECYLFKTHLVILRLSKKLGDPCLRGMEGDLDLLGDLELVREELELDPLALLLLKRKQICNESRTN